MPQVTKAKPASRFRLMGSFYNINLKRYIINPPVDRSLPPILRFHLAQLRYIQITTHQHAPITPSVIYKYINSLTTKNIKMLFQWFSQCPMGITYQAHSCIYFLSQALGPK